MGIEKTEEMDCSMWKRFNNWLNEYVGLILILNLIVNFICIYLEY